MMELNELLAWFDQGGSFGDDPEIVACMRRYIQENRLFSHGLNSYARGAALRAFHCAPGRNLYTFARDLRRAQVA